MRLGRVLATIVIVAAWWPLRSAFGQRVVVRVLETTTRTPIAGASVVLDDSARLGATDSAGILRAAGVRSGRHAPRVGKIGYRPTVTTVEVGADAVAPVQVLLDVLPVDLPLVAVNARKIDMRMSDFERRRADGGGTFFTRAQLDSNAGQTVVDLLRARSVAHFVRAEDGSEYLASATQQGPDEFRGPPRPCFAQIFVDGINVYTPDPNVPSVLPPDLRDFGVSDLDAVEFYSSVARTPPEFRSGAPACGTLVV